MTNKRILSTLLALAILLSCVGWTPAQAQGTAPVDAEIPADQTSISTLPIEEEDEDELPEREPTARLYDEEGDDLNKIVYLNNDGTRTMHLYDYPVKYRDASGEIHDISLEIADGTTELNRFQSSANSIMTAFPSKASDGISLSGEGVSIKLIPNIPAADTNTIHMTGNAKRIDSKTISYDYDAKTTIEYSLTYTGFKEDIVVSEYTGQTEYEFLLQTNGLALTRIDGSFYLTDENGKIKAAIGDVIVFTADEKNNTMGTMEAETLKENYSYLLTIVLDAQYLADPNTAYPIRIDPTIDINYDANGSGAIEDVTIYSNVTPDGASTSLFVGLRETRGISRILMRFPNLDLSSLTGATVVSAEVTLRDLICEGTYLPVYCYPFTGANWTESTASWSMTQSWGTELDNEVISYNNGVNLEPKHRYTFNITAAVQGWINGTYSKAKGLIFKTSNEVETAATYEQRQFASYNRTSYRPTFSMIYALGGTITAADNAVVKGSTLQLTAHVNETVTWKSSDPNIATINSNGVVTGVEAGEVTITATSSNYILTPFRLWVIVADGVYYIKNASSGFCLQGTSGQIHINSQKTSQDTRIDQLWKITYLQNGQYVIRPMQNLSRALTVDGGGYVAAVDAAVTDSAVTSVFCWSISYNTSGYAIQQNGSSSKAVIPVVSNMPDSSVYAGACNSSTSCYWDLEKADGLFLYETQNWTLTTENTVIPVELDSLDDLDELGLSLVSAINGKQASSIVWEVDNTTIAGIYPYSGIVLGNKRGETIIRASITIGTDEFVCGYKLRVQESIVINSFYDASFSYNTTTQGYINDAVDFLNTIYNDFYLRFENGGDAQSYASLNFETNPHTSTGACTYDGCGELCKDHHNNIHRIAGDLYDNCWSRNSVVVLWSDSSSHIYCSGDLWHETTSALALVTLVNNAGVFVPQPIVQILNLDTDDECAIQNLMAVLLAHEIAHTLGLQEVYNGDYGDSTAHNVDMTCIMARVHYDKVNALYGSGGAALCLDCRGYLQDEIPDDTYEE